MPAQTQVFDPGTAASEKYETEILLEAVEDTVRAPGDGPPASGKESSTQEELVLKYFVFCSTLVRCISPTSVPRKQISTEKSGIKLSFLIE